MRSGVHLRNIALVLLVACHGAEPPRSTTTGTERVPSPALRDSVAGPAPAGLAARLEPDVARAGEPLSAVPGVRLLPGPTPGSDPTGAAASRTFCAPVLRDPATGQRFLAARTTVQTETARPDRHTTVYRLRGWGDYRPMVLKGTGHAADQVLRVDCATNEVRGLAPTPVPDA